MNWGWAMWSFVFLFLPGIYLSDFPLYELWQQAEPISHSTSEIFLSRFPLRLVTRPVTWPEYSV